MAQLYMTTNENWKISHTMRKNSNQTGNVSNVGDKYDCIYSFKQFILLCWNMLFKNNRYKSEERK